MGFCQGQVWPFTPTPCSTPTIIPTQTPTPRYNFAIGSQQTLWTCTIQPIEQSPINFAAVAVGVVVVLFALGGVSVVVKRRKVSEQTLREMPYPEFQKWVIKRIGGSAASDPAAGFDGVAMSGQPVMIKQSDSVNSKVVENFAVDLARSRKHQGLIVAFSFNSDAANGKVKAKMAYKVDVEMVAVNDLIYSKRVF